MSGAGQLAGMDEALRPLARELCQALRDELAAARAALEGGDEAALAFRLHAMKGACMRFGLAEAAGEAAAAECRAGAARLAALARFTALLEALEREARAGLAD